MAEWLKAVDSKSTVPLWYRGFESLPLRHPSGVLYVRVIYPAKLAGELAVRSTMERCESGRIGAPGERVGAKSVPWVRIPPSPLNQVALRMLVPWTKGGRARWGGSGAL